MRSRDFHTWVIVLELGYIVDVLIDNDVQVVRLVMRRDVACLESLGHDDGHCLVRKSSVSRVWGIQRKEEDRKVTLAMCKRDHGHS